MVWFESQISKVISAEKSRGRVSGVFMLVLAVVGINGKVAEGV